MKPSFHARLVNGPFEDPGLYVRLLREGRAFLFDAGFTASLSARDILKVSDIFISHAHIDHFIGFDNILRLHLRKKEPVRLYGPEGFLDRIEGKLKGYTWNLIGDYPLIIEAAEIKEKTVTKARFRTQNSFKRENAASAPFDGVLLKDSFFKVEAAVLDHQIPCLAFSMEEDYHINIDKAELNKLNLPVGQWLGELKQAIRDGATDRVFTINDRRFNFSELRHIANITKGQKLSYVVDTIGTKENMKNIIALAKDSDVLYIEAYFLDRDNDRAKERYHLTAKEAGRIAKEAGAGRLEVFHFSPKYMDVPEEIVKEAEEEFKGRS
ncbi:MAG: MBL fold metallo-hydrolase [Nitrospirae bacterium]|nr:MBL fold metallo-hydrolase [Nitrospirota bacterium]